MAKNSNLSAAKKAKNDEFYTRREDIEEELKHYKEHFSGKTVYCNCDDPATSEFWKFFVAKFKEWDIRKLIATHYEPEEENYSYMITAEGDVDPMSYTPVRTPIQSNGDFRSAACIELLKEADIVVTNPPFSLFREYVAQLTEFGKRFVIIGNLNAITYKEIFPLLKGDNMWLGSTRFNGGATYFMGSPDLYDPDKMSNPKHAYIEDGVLYWRVNGVRWFTNLDIRRRHEPLDLRGHTYVGNEAKYPRYDNYDAINIDKVSDIPWDYNGVMGVPISFLDKYCPEQFEIIGLDRYVEDNPKYGKRFDLNGKETYARILIRRK